ncbi:MAG: FAD binding domain-containing protein, partial [Actinomycetota bacterium]|nr:FAD binding domain-containing protein [Actinomycetota bacterium]
MKPAPFSYHAANSVKEVLDLLTELGPEARVLAGGQSLVPMMNFRVAQPAHLVD